MHRHKIEQLTGDGPDHYSTVGQGLSRARTEAQSEGMWAELERDEGLAPSVRRREVGKTWRRHSEKVLGDPAIENYAPEADPTLGLHAENALKDTGQFVQRPGRKKIPTPRPDHGTINNDPDAIHRGTHHGLGRRMDNIDLADARFSGEEALVDVYDSGDVELDPETANQLKETGCFECSEESEVLGTADVGDETIKAAVFGDAEFPLDDAADRLLTDEPDVVSLDALAEESTRKIRRSGIAFADYAQTRADQSS